MYNNPAPSEWYQYRRTNDGAGFSPLKQITPANVKNLEPIWSFSTGLTKGHEVVPQYHDGILFIVAFLRRGVCSGCPQRKVPVAL